MPLNTPCPACNEFSVIVERELVNDIFTGTFYRKCINENCLMTEMTWKELVEE